ncbi:MAG: sigma-54-dependent Fis family transcriptional regulator [Desulfobacterium sp.]|nr:sigma-54-dependent Fis family transcriptional regulator [Desulfobacterium sp.]
MMIGASTRERTVGEGLETESDRNGFVADDIAGSSKAITDLLKVVKKVSVSDSSVLITGESGTGKELIARAIHRNSFRNDGPIVIINCGAIPGELLESELFGHEKGAFTGAHRSRIGRFELADKGTIFLDEIGDMSPDLQVKLLRALQERRIERVGGTTSIDVDIRILSATNKDLAASMAEGTFREDLFYRLNVIPLHIPPLRARASDIPLLLDHFQKRLGERNCGYRPKEFSDEVLAAMGAYRWPGNIRELENLMERISVLVENDLVVLSDLPDHVKMTAPTSVSSAMTAVFEKGVGFNDAVDQFQRSLIVQALNQTDWIKARAAELLKMNRTTLVEKIKKLGIEPEQEGLFLYVI